MFCPIQKNLLQCKDHARGWGPYTFYFFWIVVCCTELGDQAVRERGAEGANEYREPVKKLQPFAIPPPAPRNPSPALGGIQFPVGW
jgi:hypothetical protein